MENKFPHRGRDSKFPEQVVELRTLGSVDGTLQHKNNTSSRKCQEQGDGSQTLTDKGMEVETQLQGHGIQNTEIIGMEVRTPITRVCKYILKNKVKKLGIPRKNDMNDKDGN